MNPNFAHCCFFSFLFLFCSLYSSGQVLTGKVVGAENKIPLEGVSITDKDGNDAGQTDPNGNFRLRTPGTYTFSKEGYFHQSSVVQDNEPVVIEMEEVPLELSEIIINSDQFQSRLKDISSTIAVIPSAALRSNDEVNVAPVLNSVAGVYMHSGTLNTNRITIRGIGSRNLFGTAKIRSYYQDIPLTNGSGETTIEDIELRGIARIEILKGPSSSLYGAGLGGNIQLIPDKGRFNTNFLESGFSFGSYVLQRYWLSANFGNRTNAFKINYSNTGKEGYRENNELRRQTVTLASNHFLNENNNLNVLLNFIDMKAYIPSSLNESDYVSTPELAAPQWAASKGNEDYGKLLFGMSWQHDYDEKSKQVSSIFGTLLHLDEDRPFNILEQFTRGFGLRTRFLRNSALFEKELKWTVGLEFFNDFNDSRTFENLYLELPPGSGSERGNLLSDFEENRLYHNLFAELNYHLSAKWLLNLGMNLNHTSYKLKDRFQAEGQDFSGNREFKGVLSPKAGLTFQFADKNMAFVSVSHGFSTPNLEETLLPDGMINEEIKPETGWNYELGSRGQFLKGIFNYEISAYFMDVENLLVARRTGDDQFIGVNAGRTIHKGIEVGLNYYLVNKNNVRLGHSNSLSLNHHVFDDFKDLDNDYSGNDLTGVPDKTFFSQLDLNTSFGIYAFLNYRYVGEIPINDQNSAYSESYQLVNLKTGYQRMIGKHIDINLYLGINNIFDEKYASMLQINASSFGNAAPRYFYPGEPSNLYAGIDFRYIF